MKHTIQNERNKKFLIIEKYKMQTKLFECENFEYPNSK